MTLITASQAEALCRTLCPVPLDKTWAQHVVDSFRNGFMPESEAREVALSAVYLSIGFDGACRDQRDDARYEAWADTSGHIGVMCQLIDRAETFEKWLATKGEVEFPGVLHYEFTEALGKWLYDNGPDEADFIAELDRRWAEWTK